MQRITDDLLQQIENTDKGAAFIKKAREDKTAFCSGSDPDYNTLVWGGPTDETELFRQKLMSGLNSKFR